MTQFDFDSRKSKRNKDKHGIDFVEAQALWLSTHVVVPAKYVQEESRFAVIGEIKHKFYVAIYAYRYGVTRIISCHRADRRWVRIYEKKTKEE